MHFVSESEFYKICININPDKKEDMIGGQMGGQQEKRNVIRETSMNKKQLKTNNKRNLPRSLEGLCPHILVDLLHQTKT